MHLPPAFAETDLAALDLLLERDSFVTLATTLDGAPCASHLPVLYRRSGEHVLLEGHWARPNPQAAQHDAEALVIVHGPNAYISPGWYADKEEAARVPTWNYAIAHMHGRLECSDDPDFLADIVDRLSVEHEGRLGSDWRFERDRADHSRQLRGIVGFRLVPSRIELQFKLNQNHPAANVRGAALGLKTRGGEQPHAIAALMLDRLSRRPAT